MADARPVLPDMVVHPCALQGNRRECVLPGGTGRGLRQGGGMYQIGMFSKINRITTKALRHYDEIGLPSFVDQETGYRYYTSDQF